MSSNRIRLLSKSLISGLSLLLLVSLGAPPEAQKTISENPGFLASKGRLSYSRFCANCHGEKANGNGPVASVLTVEVPDLRLIAAQNGGVYPADRVARFVDGRSEVALHGKREMPIWGEIFQSDLLGSTSHESEEERAQRKVRELVYYLESIQLMSAPGDKQPQR